MPVAGLIAETGATLREEQFRWLRTLAALPEARRDDLLLSADRFRDPDGNPLGEEIREELLARLGMFGLRLAVQLLADGAAATSTELSAALLERSGIRELQRMLNDRYGRRAQALKARSALAALRVIGQELDRRGIAGASDLVVSVDRLEASSQALALLRLLHLVLSGPSSSLPTNARRSTGCAARRRRRSAAGTPDAGADEVRRTALDAIERWRSRAASPLSDRRTIEAAEIVSRAYEGIYAATV